MQLFSTCAVQFSVRATVTQFSLASNRDFLINDATVTVA